MQGDNNLLYSRLIMYESKGNYYVFDKHNRNSEFKSFHIAHRAPDPQATAAQIAKADLPQCHCGGLLRPHVVWFGETLDSAVLNEAGTLNNSEF